MYGMIGIVLDLDVQPQCLGVKWQKHGGILQVVKEPDDVEALGKELTLRHTRVGQQRMHRLGFVYRLARNMPYQQLLVSVWVTMRNCPPRS